MKTLELERVVFRDGVGMPDHLPTEPGKTPRTGPVEKIVGSFPTPRGQMAKEPYNLWFDSEWGVVVIEHPRSKERQEVPFGNVVQWSRKRAETPTAPQTPQAKAAK